MSSDRLQALTRLGDTIDVVVSPFIDGIDLSFDGNIVVIGESSSHNPDFGSVKVYKFISDTWTQIGNSIDGKNESDHLGYSVSISSNGNIIAISAPNLSPENRGFVRVYKNISNSWVQIGSDILGNNNWELFGNRVRLSRDGNILALSINNHSDISSNLGQVKVFKNESNNWVQIGDNIDGEFTKDKFGSDLSISGDGNILAISTPYNDANGTFRTIETINYNDFWIYTFEIYGPTVRFSTFINECLESYKPPIKSEPKTWNKAVPIDTPFEVGDLENCKIGNLTPEDHKIIQPFLFSLGYKWSSGAHLTKIDQPYLCTTGDNYIFKKSNRYGYNQLQRIEIKKETILNYIKQLNTNKNEVHRQNQEITRRTINGSARILSGRQQGSTGSRPKGNIQSIKGRETYFRRSEICGSVRLG